MTAETLKPFLSSNFNSRVKNSSARNLIIFIYSVFLVIFCVSISCLEVWNTMKTRELRQEVDQLKTVVDEMRKQLGYDILDELSDFEDAYDSNESQNSNDDYEEDEIVLDDKLLNDIKIHTSRETIGNEDDEDEDNDTEVESSGEFGIPEYNKDDDLETEVNIKSDTIDAYTIFNKRKVRSLAGLTHQGVPILEEPYANYKRNKSQQQDVDEYYNQINNDPKLKLNWKGNREIPISHEEKYLGKFHRPETHSSIVNQFSIQESAHQITTTRPQPLTARRSRVMQTTEDKSQAYRQIIKKNELARYNDFLEQKKPQEQHVLPKKRMMRQMHKRTQAPVAIHFETDPSRHYEPRVKLHENHYVDWKQASWTNTATTDKAFKMGRDGSLTVNEGGLYFIYAQILYDDDHDTNGYTINHNGQSVLQCTTMTHSQTRITKTNTCYTGSLLHLRIGDTISLKDIGNHRYVLLGGKQSFFGLVRMGSVHPNSAESNEN